ncbi:MAG: sigma 54-interacting transcriptional regulator [Isosphaeraceae bacterium]
MRTIRILLVHPDRSVMDLLRSMLQALGQPLEEADSDRAAVKFLERSAADVVVAGIDPADPDCLEFLQYLRRKFSRIPVILLFSAPHADRCKEAIARGATCVLRLPITALQLRAAVAQALGQVETDLVASPARPSPRAPGELVLHEAGAVNGHASPSGNGYTSSNHSSSANGGRAAGPAVESDSALDLTRFDGTRMASAPKVGPSSALRDPRYQPVGDDPCLRQAIELTEMIAPTRATVLIVGERGSGKSMLARALHSQSLRREGPFVEVSCGNMRESALEIEIFGRKAGFSDPLGDRPGKVALAQGGTLYIDEVTALNPELQFKLLRLLNDGEYEPVGSTQTMRADIRIVLGSRENLANWVEQGRIRQDLYGRISVVSLKLPPLRARVDDIPRLAEHFLERFARESARPITEPSPEALISSAATNGRECRGPGKPGRTGCLAWHRAHGSRSTRCLRPCKIHLRQGPRHRPMADPRLHHRSGRSRSARGAREADHPAGPGGPQLEPPGKRPGCSTSTGRPCTRR